MKIIKAHLPNNILSYTILYILVISSLHLILLFNELMFRNWVYIITIFIVIFGFFIGIIQQILKIKKQKLKCVLLSIFIIMSSIISLYIFPFLQTNDLFKSEYVVNVDGKKYITHEKGFFNTYILYYDYINVFVSGSQVRMEKDGKGNFDPINNKLDYEFEYK